MNFYKNEMRSFLKLKKEIGVEELKKIDIKN